jgi:hypothetical protein
MSIGPQAVATRALEASILSSASAKGAATRLAAHGRIGVASIAESEVPEMAKTLPRPSLYDADYLAWAEQQADHLRAGRLRELDLANIAEELEDMGRAEWRELENRLEVLLMHMLKWDYQVARRSRGWKATTREQRNAIRRLLKRSPSLKRDLEATMADVYRDAVGRAMDETGLSRHAFPDELPYSASQVLDPEPERPGAQPPGHRRR